jgi:hypothetical protein
MGQKNGALAGSKRPRPSESTDIYVLPKIHGQDESATGSKARYFNGDKHLRILRGKKVMPLKQDMQVLSDGDQTCYKKHNIIIFSL